MLDYTTHMDAPELVAVCEHCKHADCIGLCLEYKNAFRRLMGQREIGTERGGNNIRRVTVKDKLKALGETHTLAEWAKIRGISYHTLYKRVITNGWPLEIALTRKLCYGHISKIMLEVDGRKMSVNEWSVERGVSYQTIYARLARGWNDRDAVYGRQE